MCTTTHYETHVSTECSRFGNGQCDGYCYEHNITCTCSCHSNWEADLPTTVTGMQAWHDLENGVVERFDAVSKARIVCDHLTKHHPSYRGVAGARYEVVTLTNQPDVHFVIVDFD